jgi:hypothetical protein
MSAICDDPIMNAFNRVDDCRLQCAQAWADSEQDYYAVIYQVALIAYDEAVIAYNKTLS